MENLTSKSILPLKVPGPPSDLRLEKASENALKIRWSQPKYSVNGDFITDYHVKVMVVDSYDLNVNSRTFSPKEITLSKFNRMTTILGLKPASKYNVSVQASSKHGLGQAVSKLFWTEIGKPQAPEAPTLIHHGHDHDHDFEGEIHVQLKGKVFSKVKLSSKISTSFEFSR